MPRIRTATEAVAELDRQSVLRALEASMAAQTMERFYRDVGMRNPSRSYFVRFNGRLHSLKAVATSALQQSDSNIVSRDFHAADAAARFRDLGFDVIHADSGSEAERQRVWTERIARPQQARFREKLVDLYGKCAFSSCATLRALEAAHVDPVHKAGLDDPSNGILLRADLHRLFDADLIAVDPADGRLHVAEACRDDYADLGELVFIPPPGGPPLSAFAVRWSSFSAD